MGTELGAMEISGLATDAVNGAVNLGFGIYDRINQNKQQQQNQENWNAAFAYQKQMDEQAQKNWQAQMDFQKQQFDANRIGNLTKEYADAGLNPALAAGMGASTASTISAAGRGNTPNPNTSALVSHQQAQIKLANTQAMAQIRNQKDLTDAEVEKMKAEANLANTQASDIANSSDAKLENIKANTEAVKKSVDEAIERIAKMEAEIKGINANTVKTELETDLLKPEVMRANFESDVWEIINNDPQLNKKMNKKMKQKIFAEIDKAKTENRFKTAMTVEAYLTSVCNVIQSATGVATSKTTLTEVYTKGLHKGLNY